MYYLSTLFTLISLAFLPMTTPGTSDQGDVLISLEFHSIQGSCFTDAQGNPAVNGHTQIYRLEFMAELSIHDIELINVRIHPSRGQNARYLGHYEINGQYFVDLVGCGTPRLEATPIIGGVIFPPVISPGIPLNDRCC